MTGFKDQKIKGFITSEFFFACSLIHWCLFPKRKLVNYNFFTVKLSLITINKIPQSIILHYLPALMYLFIIYYCQASWPCKLLSTYLWNKLGLWFGQYTPGYFSCHINRNKIYILFFLLNNFLSQYLFNLMNQFIWSISFSDDWLLAKIGNRNKNKKNEYNGRKMGAKKESK